MIKSLLVLLISIFLSSPSIAERELYHSDWAGLYLPDYMINNKEYPELTMAHSYESYVLIVSYKDKLIVKAKVFAGNPKKIRVSEFEGEINNPKLKKQIIKDGNCKLSVEFIKDKDINKLKLKDKGYSECGPVRFDDVYYQHENPSWKRFQTLD